MAEQTEIPDDFFDDKNQQPRKGQPEVKQPESKERNGIRKFLIETVSPIAVSAVLLYPSVLLLTNSGVLGNNTKDYGVIIDSLRAVNLTDKSNANILITEMEELLILQEKKAILTTQLQIEVSGGVGRPGYGPRAKTIENEIKILTNNIQDKRKQIEILKQKFP